MSSPEIQVFAYTPNRPQLHLRESSAIYRKAGNADVKTIAAGMRSASNRSRSDRS